MSILKKKNLALATLLAVFFTGSILASNVNSGFVDTFSDGVDNDGSPVNWVRVDKTSDGSASWETSDGPKGESINITVNEGSGNWDIAADGGRPPRGFDHVNFTTIENAEKIRVSVNLTNLDGSGSRMGVQLSQPVDFQEGIYAGYESNNDNLECKDDSGSHTNTGAGIGPNKGWLEANITYWSGNSSWKCTVATKSETVEFTGSDSGNHSILLFGIGSFSSDGDNNDIHSARFHRFSLTRFNSPPSINSKDHFPKPTELNDEVSYHLNATEPDGESCNAYIDIDYWNNGTDVKNSKMAGTGGCDFEEKNIIEATVQDDGYNATLKVSDGKANTTTTENFFIQDSSPGLVINKPKNQTYFDYDLSWKISNNDDGDDVNGEISSCNVWNDGNLLDSLTLSEGSSSATKSFRADIQQHKLNASCTEKNGSQLTTNKKRYYTVDNYERQTYSSKTQVYETVNTSYKIEIKLGDMVEELENTLQFDGNSVSTKKYSHGNTVKTVTQKLYHEIPLVSSNASSKSWAFNYNINYTKFSGGFKENNEYASSSQTVWQGFYLQKQYTDKKRYLERDNSIYKAQIYNHTSKPGINTDVQTNLTQKIEELSLNDTENTKSNFTEVVELPNVEKDKQTVKYTSNFTISFKGEKRTFTNPSIQRPVYQFGLTDCGGSYPTALQFNTWWEKDFDEAIVSDLVAAIQVWNSNDPGFKRTFNFSSEDTSKHKFCIKPGWAELKADSTEKLIQYYDSGTTSSDWRRRSYFIRNETITKSKTEIPLYMAWSNQTNRVDVTVEDDQGNPVSSAIITFERYFPSKDKYITVSMTRTGSQGQSETFLEVNEIYYQFKIFKNGKLLTEKPPQTIPSDLSLIFQLGDDVTAGYFDLKGQVQYNCQLENTTRFSCSYSAPANAEKLSLNIKEQMQIGFNTTCTVSSVSENAELVCNNLNTTTSKYRYSFKVQYPSQKFAVDTGWIGNISPDYGKTGLFVYFMMFITLGFAGLWKPEASIALGMLATLTGYIVGFLAVTQTALVSFLAIGTVLIWRMS